MRRGSEGVGGGACKNVPRALDACVSAEEEALDEDVQSAGNEAKG